MLSTITLLLLNFIVANAAYTKNKDLGKQTLNRKIVTTSGNKLELTGIEEDVRLYTNANDFGSDAGLFQCLFAEDGSYSTVQQNDPLGCIAFYYKEAAEATCEKNISHGIGLTEKKNKDLCWMSKTGISCALDVPAKNTEAVKALAEQLKDHSENIAKCASAAILADTVTTTTVAKSTGKSTTVTKKASVSKQPRTVKNKPREDEEDTEETSTEPVEDVTEENDEESDEKESSKKKQGKKNKDKGKKGETIMWNETARLLSVIGVAASVLLFLQILVLAMAIKLIKRQAFR